MNQGWQCPACKKVYAPSITECVCAVNVIVDIQPSSGMTTPQFIYPCPAGCELTGGCENCRPSIFFTSSLVLQ